ncbi:MAG: cyclic nucleotide-binding domain-containing protein [Chloracidobacterium sp.]|uniref:Cyclic nucleotide-binding domain-containing protein n=1 Tax=Chloracidobacterium validum TaxID=2821543 RepID=A0ABX8B7A7_9BACT|nr:cyclic nucleotide-binding domain-containing protein [Chloracidobacterium validum]QUW02536.1 cyclic nucleotide-binding domain-containing protein [Chloracidobacterium validum]
MSSPDPRPTTLAFAFLRECELFSSLSDLTLQALFLRGEVLNFEPGDDLFHIGDPANYLYVIKSGVVEIRRPVAEGAKELTPVAYIAAGDVLGEVAMFTKSTRASAARLPGGGEVFRISSENFHSVVAGFPDLALRLCFTFAQRLESTVRNMRKERQRQLSGNLQFFDLPTVIQTIIGSGMTGTLRVDDPLGITLAEIFFDSGHLCRSVMGHLTGSEAFFQLFQPPPTEGVFEFKGGEREVSEGASCDILLPGMTMLMEAVRMQDEVGALRRRFPANQTYRPLGDDLRWDGEEQLLPIAYDIWYRLHAAEPTVRELLDTVPASHYTTLSILNTLLETMQITAQQQDAKALTNISEPGQDPLLELDM